MAKDKLRRFAEIETFSNVFKLVQIDSSVADMPLKGKWKTGYFKNGNPLVLEVGCGKGEYSVGLATKFTNKNFIGADLKGNRIWVGAKQALDNKITNVAFVRTRVENIAHIFSIGEVDELWITFPDPQPQKPRERKRLTADRFLNLYKQVVKPGGIVHLKTDSFPFYEYSLEKVKEHGLEVLFNTTDLYADERVNDANAIDYGLRTIKTHYEDLFSKKGFKINYLRFKL